MAVLRMSLVEWETYHKRLAKQFLPAALRGARSAGMRAVVVAVRRTREAPPANPQGKGSGGAVNTGDYLRAWRSLTIPDGARVLNNRPQSSIIEYGRRPYPDGRKGMPPLDVIMRWAQRRLGLSEEEARHAAFPIAKAIKRRGLIARQVLTSDDAQDEIAKLLHEEVIRELERELAKPPSTL